MSEHGTKKFGGKLYHFCCPARTKVEANRLAKEERKNGFFARITATKPLYGIWVRKMHRGEY